MKRFLNTKCAYAVALALAAASGSLFAMAGSAQANTHMMLANAASGKNVVLSSQALIERIEKKADGTEVTMLKTPSEVVVVPGDKVVFTLSYENKGEVNASGFRATNPMPKPIQFIEVNEKWAEVSVDGGLNWGKLDQLEITETIEGDAEYDEETGAKISDAFSRQEVRMASAEDVTHVRWVFDKAIAPGEKGDVSYRGIVK